MLVVEQSTSLVDTIFWHIRVTNSAETVSVEVLPAEHGRCSPRDVLKFELYILVTSSFSLLSEYKDHVFRTARREHHVEFRTWRTSPGDPHVVTLSERAARAELF